MPLSLKNASTGKVLLQMMASKTTHYPTRKALNEALEEAYDASLTSGVSLFYDQVELKFQLRFVHPQHLNDDKYEALLMTIFKEVLDHPLFDQTLCDQEKSFILDDILTKESQKSYLASSMLTDTLLEGHPYYLSTKDEKASIEAVRLEDVKALYQDMMNAPRVMTVTGDVNEETLKRWMTHLNLQKNHRYTPSPILKNPVIKKPDFTHRTPMHQVYRYLVYDTKIYRDDPSYPAFQVFTHILGGDSDSILFKRIRETHSMAYSVNAIPSIKYGLLIIQGSIDPAKDALFDDEVTHILDELKTDGVNEETLTLAKQSIQERLKRNSDSAGVLTKRALSHYFFNDPFEIHEALKDIENVTNEDIKVMARQLSSVYAFKYGGSDEA